MTLPKRSPFPRRKPYKSPGYDLSPVHYMKWGKPYASSNKKKRTRTGKSKKSVLRMPSQSEGTRTGKSKKSVLRTPSPTPSSSDDSSNDSEEDYYYDSYDDDCRGGRHRNDPCEHRYVEARGEYTPEPAPAPLSEDDDYSYCHMKLRSSKKWH